MLALVPAASGRSGTDPSSCWPFPAFSAKGYKLESLPLNRETLGGPLPSPASASPFEPDWDGHDGLHEPLQGHCFSFFVLTPKFALIQAWTTRCWELSWALLAPVGP